MYDLVLKGGLVVDGTGEEPYVANVCIQNGKISCITKEDREGKEILSVEGLAVTPGFIDIHSHSDSVPFFNSLPQGKIMQGVTLEISGNCGSGIVPIDGDHWEEAEAHSKTKKGHIGFSSVTDYAAAVDEKGYVSHFGFLLGHGTLRIAAMGFVNREPDEKELDAMKDLLEREMKRGAFGMSLGLIYPPSAFSSREELVELAKIIAKYDGILAVHMRNESVKIFESVDEVIDIAEKSGVHVQISHIKLMGKPQWGRAAELIEKIDRARAKGIQITCDQYPYPASSTSLSALVPHWAHEGGSAALTERVRNREGNILEGIRTEMENRGGADCIMPVACPSHPEYEGKTILQISREFQLDPAETVCKILVETGCRISCVFFCINEEDVRYIMKQPYVCVGSDSQAQNYTIRNNPHPRGFAAFSQYFQTVREHSILPLEKMVRKATGLTASILGIRDRGVLKEGNIADIAVFDPTTFASQSTFTAPKARPIGMKHVLVHGSFAVRDGEMTGVCAGKAILKEIADQD